jgi:predicted kinase
MNKMLTAYKKVHQTIISCTTPEQVVSAKKLVTNFHKLFNIQKLTEILEILVDRKKFLIEMEIRPVVYMLIGPPGIGKSTYIKEMLLPNGEYTVVSTDNLLEEKGKKIGLSYNEAFNEFNFKEIEKEFFINLKIAINERQDIVVDRTNMSKKGRRRVLNLFPKDYLKIGILFDFSNRAKLDTQLNKRLSETGKHISKKTVDRMIESYKEPTLEEFDYITKI